MKIQGEGSKWTCHHVWWKAFSFLLFHFVSLSQLYTVLQPHHFLSVLPQPLYPRQTLKSSLLLIDLCLYVKSVQKTFPDHPRKGSLLSYYLLTQNFNCFLHSSLSQLAIILFVYYLLRFISLPHSTLSLLRTETGCVMFPILSPQAQHPVWHWWLMQESQEGKKQTTREADGFSIPQ